jgi:hypothetical protein
VPVRVRSRWGFLAGSVALLALAAPSAALAELEPNAVIGAGYMPAAVNDNGQVAVNILQGAGLAQIEVASIWNPDGTGSGTFMPLNPLYSGGQSIVTAMNASGQSVGDSGIDSTKTDLAATLWSDEGSPTNIDATGQNGQSGGQAYSIAPDGTPGGDIEYCPPGGGCYSPAPAMGDPLALVGPTGLDAGTGSINSINSSDQGVAYEIYTFGSDVATPFADGVTGTGADIFDNGAVVFGEFNIDGYVGVDYQSPDGVVTSIPCGPGSPTTAQGGANEYGDIATQSPGANDQYIWHSGVCYPLESVEPGLLTGWTFPTTPGGPVINGLGQIATVGDPPGSSTATGVFFTPQYPNPPAYQLTGTVKTAAGQPVPGVTVQVLRASGQQVAPAVKTGSDGSYTYTLNSADYVVSVGSSGTVAAGSACVTATTSTCTVNLTANRVANFTAPASAGSGPGPGSPKAKVSKPKTSGTSAGASVSCTGSAGGSCTVTLTLSVTETLSGNKVTAVSASKHKPKKTKRTVVIGTTTVKLAAGQTKTVSVSLNGTGKRLLKSRHSLSVKLTASQKNGAKSTFTVKFTAKKGKHK